MNEIGAVELWRSVMDVLNQSEQTHRSSMNALFSSLEPVALGEEGLVLKTNNLFARDWVERRLGSAIRDAIWSVSGKDYAFRIAFAKPSSNLQDLPVQTPLPQEPPVSVFVTSPSVDISPVMPSLTIASEYASPLVVDIKKTNNDFGIEPATTYQGMTFESFVVGEANQTAFSMAVNVAKAPGYIMNPLFIYGKSGLGKTHLLLSIRHYIKEHKPELNALYFQTNEILGDFTHSIRQNDWEGFNRKYFSADVFLLDDVQFLERGVETTNTVFNILNRLLSENKQVVLSADRSPNEINLHERYLSRFNSGVIADVQPHSFETKLVIFNNYLDFCCLQRFNCAEVRSLIPRDVAEYIVSLSGNNIRELEGATTSLVFMLSQEKNRYHHLSKEEADTIISKHFRRRENHTIDIDMVLKETESFFNVRHADMLSKRRSQDISYPRQVAMYLCRTLIPDASFPSIGKAFGGKDHTSVIHAYNNIEKRRHLSAKTDKDVKELMELLVG